MRLFTWLGRLIPLPALFPILLMSLLAGLTIWLNRTVRSVAPPPPKPVVHQPDYTMEKIRIRRFNDKGELRYVLEADKLVHYPDNDLAHLTRPVITRYRPDTLATNKPRPPTRMRAERGATTYGGDEGYFYDNVIYQRPPFEKDEQLLIYTNYAHLLNDYDVFRTTESATVIKGKSVLEGVGMEYDHGTRTINVLSRVNTRMEKKEKDRQPIKTLPPEFAKGLNPDSLPPRPAPLPPVLSLAPPGVAGERVPPVPSAAPAALPAGASAPAPVKSP